jgi:CheY-like chemotaxis protein
METHPLPPVMIVDDDPLFRTLTRLLLESHGVTVCDAGGCAEAVALLPTAKPGLAIVDMIMPDFDGLQTISALRSAESELRFIACSGHDREQFREGLRQLCVQYFIPKPFAIDTLLHTMHCAMLTQPAAEVA